MQLENYYPTVRCCSPFYAIKKERKTNDIDKILKKMDDIHDLDTESIDINLHKLKTLTKIDFSNFSEKSSNIFIISIIILSLIAILYIIYKFQHLIIFCCSRKEGNSSRNSSRSPTVRYNIAEEVCLNSNRLKF